MNDKEEPIYKQIIRQRAAEYNELEFPDFAKWLHHSADREDIWESVLDERETKELEFSRTYADNFAHGTSGHNRLMLIAKMARLLDVYEDALHMLIGYVEQEKK